MAPDWEEAQTVSSLVPRLRTRGLITRLISNPVARVLIALRISPNLITLAGFGVAAYSAYLLSDGRLLIGGIVMIIGAAMDMLDGAVARLAGKESTFGAFFDSVMDRLGEAVVLFGLAVFYMRASDALGVYLVFGALTSSMMVSYLRARSEGLAIPGDVGLLGRPERVVVLGVALLAGYPLHGLGVIAALASLTVVQRGWHVWRVTRAARD